MADAIMLEIAGAVAKGALEAGGEMAKDAVSAVVKLVRGKLGHSEAATGVLEAAVAEPSSERVTALADVIAHEAAGDARFDAGLRRLWSQARGEAGGGEGGAGVV